MRRFIDRYLGPLTLGFILLGGLLGIVLNCTFRIEPIVEVNDASITFGPIQVCYDAGAQ